jgi:hypothetical protein
MLRLVPDILQITGTISLDEHKNIRKIILNPADSFARQIQAGLARLSLLPINFRLLIAKSLQSHCKVIAK